MRAPRHGRAGVAARSARTAAALTVAAGLAAGCGEDSGPSKDGYVAAADRICQTARATAAPLVARVSKAGTSSLLPGPRRRLARDLQRLHELGVGYVTDLGALEPPPADAEQVRAFLVATSEVVDAVGVGRDAVAAGNMVRALSLLQRARTVDDQAAAAAREYGFKQCGSVIAPPS